MKPRKSIAMQLAEHWGCDVADIREYDYQPGLWTRKVYAGMDGTRYWSAGGDKPPRHRDGGDIVWTQVPSSWPGNGHLWMGISADEVAA